ncbi:MAG: PEGA domain-containing protein [Opitutaceae bacterium]
MANDSVCFLEQTDFSLLLARSAAGVQPLRLEALQEVPLADAAALNAAVREVFASESASVVCALRPKPRLLHLATADDARLNPGLAGARQFATTLPTLSSLPPGWLAAAQARDGVAPGSAPWLMSVTSAEGQAAATTLLDTLQLKTVRRVSATLNTAGAFASNVAAPTWLLEIGELSSHALLISADGVLAAGLVSLNLERIAEAVQAELGLKFRGSAIKLFFNPVYDYNDVGPKIAARIAAALKSELAALRGANPAPVALACAGLPAAQHWFTTQLAAALELAPIVPPAVSGLTFASPELEATISPAWFGFLRLIATGGTGAWESEWLKLDTIALPVATKAPAPTPAPAPAPAPVVRTPAAVIAPPAPKLAPVTPASAPAPVAPKPVAPKPAVPAPFPMPDSNPAPRAAAATPAAKPAATAAPAPTPTPAAPAPKLIAPKPVTPIPAPAPAKAAPAPASAPAKPTPAPASKPGATAKPASTPSAVSYSSKTIGAEKSAAAAPKKTTPPPPVALPVNTLPMAELPPSKPLRKNKAVLVVVALLLVFGIGGYFFVQWQSKEAARLNDEKARAEQRLQVEIAKTRAVEAKAHAEAEARKKLEAEVAQKLADAEAGRQRAETDARQQTAARLANARGALTIESDPAGAMVTVGDLSPRPTPASYTDLKIGKYPVSIALPLYDTAQLELEVKDGGTTDSGVVKLVKILGSLELITEPSGVAYEVKPANALFVAADSRRTGHTPDTLTDLIPGDYTVTFVREGWMPQVETATIARDVTAHVKGVFPNGIVKISSKPAGAVVSRDGVRAGVTPLTLSDQQPGEANYVLTLPGYAPEPVTGRIVGGQELDLSPTLELYDHLSKLSDLDQPPKVLTTVQPKIPYEFRLARKSAQVNIELTVTRDGTPKDLVVLPGSDRTLSAACLTAAAQWKFRPGSLHGKPANVRMIVPFAVEAGEE